MDSPRDGHRSSRPGTEQKYEDGDNFDLDERKTELAEKWTKFGIEPLDRDILVRHQRSRFIFHFRKRKVPFCLCLSANPKEDISLERLVDRRKRKGVQWVWGFHWGSLLNVSDRTGRFLAGAATPGRRVSTSLPL